MRQRWFAPLLVLLLVLCPAGVHAEPLTPGTAHPPRDPLIAPLDDPAPSGLQEWKERWLPPPDAPGQAPLAALDLVGGNFAIADYLDPSTPTENLDGAAVAYSSARSEYLVVWQAYLAATGNNLYAQRYNAAGAPISIIYNISVGPGHQVAPSVAYDAASNQYWVAWTDTRSGTRLQAYLRRLTAVGVPVGDEILVSPPSIDGYAARVAAGGGRGVVVWTSDPDDGNSHVLVRCFDQNGNEAVGTLLLSEQFGVVGEPDICYNGEDQHFMAVWDAWVQATGWDVWGHGLTINMQAATQRLVLERTSAAHRYPRVAYSPQGDKYLVVWQDGRSGVTWDIYGRFLARNGATSGAALPIYAGPYTDSRPSVAAQGNGAAFLVPFERSLTAGDRMQIYASTVSSGGAVAAPFAIRIWHNVRYLPAIAARGGSNEYLVAWTDRGALTQDDIFAQRVRHDGSLLGGHLSVALGRKGQELPRAAFNPSAQEYLVVWQDYRDGADYVLYGRRLSSSGGLLGSELIIANAAMLHGDAAVTYSPTANQYLVVWQQVTSPASGYDIYAQRLSATGQKVGAAIFVSAGTNTTDEGQPCVAWNSNRNEYYVAWHAFTDARWRIYGQRVSAAGQLLGSNTLLSYGSQFTHAARLAYNSQLDEYLVVWQDTRQDSRIDIYAQRVGGLGARIGDNMPVSTAPGSKGFCDVAYRAGHNEYLVVWGDSRDASANIYGQRLTAAATLLGAEIPVATDDLSQYAPSVAYVAASDQYLVSWREAHEATDFDLYARTITAAGAPQARFAVTTAPEVQSRGEMAYNSATGQVLLVWDDFRAQNYDIYGQRWQLGAVPPPATPTPTPTRTPTIVPGLKQRGTIPIIMK